GNGRAAMSSPSEAHAPARIEYRTRRRLPLLSAASVECSPSPSRRQRRSTMSDRGTRRTFLKRSAATVAALQAPALAAAEKARDRYLCVTCGIQFKETDGPPPRCPICEDERQYVGWEGQKWLTLGQMQGKFRNTIKQEEADLHSVFTQGKV